MPQAKRNPHLPAQTWKTSCRHHQCGPGNGDICLRPKSIPTRRAAEEQNSRRLSCSARTARVQVRNRFVAMTTNPQRLLWSAALCDFDATSLLYVLPRRQRAVKGAVSYRPRCAPAITPADMRGGAS